MELTLFVKHQINQQDSEFNRWKQYWLWCIPIVRCWQARENVTSSIINNKRNHIFKILLPFHSAKPKPMKSIDTAGCWLNIISIWSTLANKVLYMDILQIQFSKKDLSAYLVEQPFYFPQSICFVCNSAWFSFFIYRSVELTQVYP